MNETNIRVCLIVFHFHLFVVGLWWMQEANSFSFKDALSKDSAFFVCLCQSISLAIYLSFRSLPSPFIHRRFSSSLAKAMLLHAKLNEFASQEH